MLLLGIVAAAVTLLMLYFLIIPLLQVVTDIDRWDVVRAWAPWVALYSALALLSGWGCKAAWGAAIRCFRADKTEPNQAPEPTPPAVTPPAGQEARQP